MFDLSREGLRYFDSQLPPTAKVVGYQSIPYHPAQNLDIVILDHLIRERNDDQDISLLTFSKSKGYIYESVMRVNNAFEDIIPQPTYGSLQKPSHHFTKKKLIKRREVGRLKKYKEEKRKTPEKKHIIEWLTFLRQMSFQHPNKSLHSMYESFMMSERIHREVDPGYKSCIYYARKEGFTTIVKHRWEQEREQKRGHKWKVKVKAHDILIKKEADIIKLIQSGMSVADIYESLEGVVKYAALYYWLKKRGLI